MPQRFQQILLAIFALLFFVLLARPSVLAQDDEPLAPDVTEFKTDELIRSLPDDCPNCAIADIDKTWEKVVVTVGFMGGTQEHHEFVEEIASQWEDHALIDFHFGDFDEPDIRIAFEADGNWSAIGTDALSRDPSEPTMNLENVEQRTILHEFGHALGLMHEHQHPDAGIRWDREAVYEAYTELGWTRDEIDQNLFAALSRDSYNTGEYDPDSIMHYFIDPEWTLDDFEVPLNEELSEIEKAYVAELYPDAPERRAQFEQELEILEENFDPVPDTPVPDAWMYIGQEKQLAGVASFTWSRDWADIFGVSTPGLPIFTSDRKFTADFVFAPAVGSQTVNFSVAPVDQSTGQRTAWGYWYWEWPLESETYSYPNNPRPSLELTLEPGLYVIEASAFGPQGDATYGFLVRVVDSVTASDLGDGKGGDNAILATVATDGSSRLNVRSGPGTAYPIIGKAPNGTTYLVTGRNQDGTWLQINASDISNQGGWVAAAFVRLSGTSVNLPVVTSNTVQTGKDGRGSTADTSIAHGNGTADGTNNPPAALSGKLAVPVWDSSSGMYSIYLVNADGSNLRKVIANGSSPALSPDGRRIAFRDWDRSNRGIVIANADGSGRERFTSFLEDVLPAWSPDSRQVMFSSYREGDRKSRIYYLWTDQQNDWVLKRGPDAVYGEDPYWMSSGRVAYVLHSRLPQDQLLTMNSNGSAPTVLQNDKTVRSPAAAPDGRSLVVMSKRSGNWDIYRVNIDGTNLQQLTTSSANDGLPTWSPDGSGIAFVSDRSGRWELWAMNPDGSNQRVITALPGSVDGTVRNEMDYLTNGWLEEQISWSR